MLHLFPFLAQLWRETETQDGMLLENRLRCWDGTYCRKNYKSFPQNEEAGFIEFDKVLTVDDSIQNVAFQMKKNNSECIRVYLIT